MATARITLDENTLTPGLKEFPQRLGRGIAAIMRKRAPDVESYMKTNAPWTDRTGNARQGLVAEYEAKTLDHSIVLSYSVPYGIWLEVIQDGRYAIIQPTVRVWGPKIMKDFDKLLERF